MEEDAGPSMPVASTSTPLGSSKQARKSKGQTGKEPAAEQEASDAVAAAASPAPSTSETKGKAARKSGTSKPAQSKSSNKVTKDSLISGATNMDADSEPPQTPTGTAAPAAKR